MKLVQMKTEEMDLDFTIDTVKRKGQYLRSKRTKRLFPGTSSKALETSLLDSAQGTAHVCMNAQNTIKTYQNSKTKSYFRNKNDCESLYQSQLLHFIFSMTQSKVLKPCLQAITKPQKYASHDFVEVAI